MDKTEQIWTDPENPAGFKGVKKLWKATHNSKSETQKWLSNQLAYSLNKPMLKRFQTRPYKTFGIDDLWQMDLMEMIPYSGINKGYKYILTCVDVFSRFARAIPIKSKSANDMEAAVKTIFKEGHPDNLQTDLGKEFYHSKVKNIINHLKINHYSVFSQYKAAYVERFNRTLRDALKKYFVDTGNKTCINVLSKVIDSYNHTGHKGLNGARPVDVSSDNSMKLWLLRQQPKVIKKPKYKIGDHVRISRISASPFIKNFNSNWSDEVFQITKINTKQNPIMYVIKDHEENIIVGKFYEQELQVIPQPTLFRIEKIIISKGTGKYKQLYVKWHGYEKPSWIAASQVVN